MRKEHIFNTKRDREKFRSDADIDDPKLVAASVVRHVPKGHVELLIESRLQRQSGYKC